MRGVFPRIYVLAMNPPVSFQCPSRRCWMPLRTIPLHAFAAMAAFALGIVQFAAPKGTLPHRTIGWIWVALMARRHQFILDPRDPPGRAIQPDPSAVDLHADHAGARGVVRPAAQGRAASRITMISIFFGALVIAGLFTFCRAGSCMRWFSAIRARLETRVPAPVFRALKCRVPQPPEGRLRSR